MKPRAASARDAGLRKRVRWPRRRAAPPLASGTRRL